MSPLLTGLSRRFRRAAAGAAAPFGTDRSGDFTLTNALSDCGASPDPFVVANNPDEIHAGLATIFKQYLCSVRLTQ